MTATNAPAIGDVFDFTYTACQCSFGHIDLCRKPVTFTSREVVVRYRTDKAGVLLAVGHLGSTHVIQQP